MKKTPQYELMSKQNRLVNRLLQTILLLSLSGFMLIAVNELQPTWLSNYTSGYSILKISMSVLLFGLFASLNTCILLVSKQVKSR